MYPKQCRGDTFVETCGGVTRKMLAMNQPFSLLHDFRAVNYNLVDWNSNFQFFDAANEVTQKGFVSAVALVITGCSPYLLGTVNAMLWMSPVQPVKVFEGHHEALKWCEQNRRTEH